MNVSIIWDLDDDEEGSVLHIAEHGLEKDDIADVFDHPVGIGTSDSSHAKQITRDRKLTPAEAAKYRQIREEVEREKPEIIAQAQRARREARCRSLLLRRVEYMIVGG